MALWDTFKVVLLTSVIVYFLPNIMKKNIPEDKVQGSCSPEFKEVESIYIDNFVSGLDRGGSMSVYYKGQQVCDMWGGYADERIQRPWIKDTVSIMFSSTKIVTALCLLKLHDKGLLNYSKPVIHYWPEFGQNGKESITVEQLVSHQAGLAATDSVIGFNLLKLDPDYVMKAFEKQKPIWNPGEGHGYHAFTFGPLMDHLIRKVDPKHRSLDVFFKEEIADPFDIDIHIGLPIPEQHRAAFFQNPGLLEFIKASVSSPSFIYAVTNFVNNKLFDRVMDVNIDANLDFFTEYIHWPEARAISHGAMNGYGNARAIAKLLSAFTHGGLMPDGKRLVSEASVKLFTKPVDTGMDKVVFRNTTLGYGSYHFSEDSNKHRVGHHGYAGQMASYDEHYDFSYSFITTKGTLFLDEDDTRAMRIRKAIYNSIDKIKGQ